MSRAGEGRSWIACSDRLPEMIEDASTMWGGVRRSADCIVLYADDPKHWDDDGPHISSAFLLEYDGGTLEWVYRIDRTGGLERCSSHGGPVPTHWMPMPALRAVGEG
jgi:hypothetical protein